MLSEDFAAQLADGMASLFKELGIEPGAGSKGPDETAERERLATAWEAMLVDGMDTMSGPSGASGARTSADAASPGLGGGDFQSRIRSAMDKRKESESGLKSSGSGASGGGDDFEALLSQLGELGDLPGDGADGEEHIEGVLEAMMGQLMSKDVLYEPLKELQDKVSRHHFHIISLTRCMNRRSSLGISPSTAAPCPLKIRNASRRKYRASSG